MHEMLRQLGLISLLASVLSGSALAAKPAFVAPVAPIVALRGVPFALGLDAQTRVAYVDVPDAASALSTGSASTAMPDHVVSVSLSNGAIVADSATAVGITALVTDPARHRVYAPDSHGSITVLDTANGRVRGYLRTLAQWIVTVLPVGATRLIVGADTTGIIVYDTLTWRQLSFLRLGMAASIAVSGDERVAYVATVSNERTPGGLYAIDLHSGQLRRAAARGADFSYLHVDEAHHLLIAADRSGTVTMRDSGTLAVRHTTYVGPNPGPFLYDATAARLWVVNRSLDQVHFIDVRRGRRLTTVQLLGDPVSIVGDSVSHRALIVQDDGTALVVSTLTGRLLRTVNVLRSADGPRWITAAVSEDGLSGRVLLAGSVADRGLCAVLDLRRATLLRRLACPADPYLAALDPSGQAWIVGGATAPPPAQTWLTQLLDPLAGRLTSLGQSGASASVPGSLMAIHETL